MKNSGFTLIELLVVIAIVGALLGIVLPQVSTMIDSAREHATKKNLQNIQNAIFDWMRANGGQLPNANDLITIRNDYFGGRWPDTKLRRGVTNTNTTTLTLVQDTNIANGLLDRAELPGGNGGWVYLGNTFGNQAGLVAVNSWSRPLDRTISRYCEWSGTGGTISVGPCPPDK